MSGETEIVNLVQRLSNYLLDHPRASDTADGIAAWWTAPGAPPSDAVLQAALAWMIDCGVLATFQAADGRTHYRCRHELADLRLRLELGRNLGSLAGGPGAAGGRRGRRPH
jgi:acyl-CoA thioesterase